jgi:hypothetical protein
MSFQEYIQYLTERLFRYLDTPKEKRKESRRLKNSGTLSSTWFGVIPVAIRMWLHKHR